MNPTGSTHRKMEGRGPGAPYSLLDTYHLSLGVAAHENQVDGALPGAGRLLLLGEVDPDPGTPRLSQESRKTPAGARGDIPWGPSCGHEAHFLLEAGEMVRILMLLIWGSCAQERGA